MIPVVKVVKTVVVEVPDLGQRIHEARKQAQAAGKSMTDIAAAAGMSTQNWYRIEKERQMLPVETLEVIEGVLNVDFGVEFGEAAPAK